MKQNQGLQLSFSSETPENPYSLLCRLIIQKYF